MDAVRPPGSPDGSGGGSVVPDEAPPLLWLLLAVALALWWLWPWLEKWHAQARAPAPVPAAASGLGAAASAAAARAAGASPAAHSGDESAAADCSESYLGQSPEAEAARGGGQAGGRAVEELGFDLAEEFRQAFTGAADFIGQALSGPPSGKAYTAANQALHHLVEILDRVFQAFGSPEELAKVTRLRESSDAFGRSFGEQRHGAAMRGLLQVAGFERRCAGGAQEGDVGNGDAYWVLPHAEASARLHGLTVRLCLQKFKELQRLRGPGRWLHQNNEAVIPKLEDAAFAELVDLYSSVESSPSEPRPSMRERNLEANVRIAIGQRRAERGLDEPLALHKGLAGVARVLADAQRVKARTERPGGSFRDLLAPGAEVAEEIRSRVAQLPLPPGFSVAHLHWSSNELPRLFGLASTKGGGGKEDAGESSDQAADILSNEAVGYWAVRQECDMFWPAAMLCGVGAALDYTVNKGFVVALLLGFEQPARPEGGEPLDSGDTLRRRSAAAIAARKRASASGGSGAAGGGSFAPRTDAPAPRRVVGLGDLSRPSGGG